MLLLKGPKALGYQTPRWTCLRVADLIQREFGVRYHAGHVWKILDALGWNPQQSAELGNDRKEHETPPWKGKV